MTFVRDSLERQADYRTQQALRRSVVEDLAGGADFELPASLVQRQTMRKLERKVLELRRSGFDEDNIRRFVNASKQNAQATTEAALREHFILEQIAEEQSIDADENDYEAEIQLIAQQSGHARTACACPARKAGPNGRASQPDCERKVIEMIVDGAKVTEEKVENKEGDESSEFAVDHSVLATKDNMAIPEAKYDDNTPAGAQEKDADKD